MFDKAFKARMAFLILEWSSIPLLIGFYLLFLSGYGLIARKTRYLTFGLIGRAESLYLHVLSPLPYLVGVLMVIHAFAGFELMILRHARNPLLSTVLEIANLAAAIFLLAQLTILEFA
ncbi:MAG: hypothetical protein J7K49_02765 [Thaumarchaeota archaeon]|nr:hypothetical protein [Nitrososphaerota archaeon]